MSCPAETLLTMGVYTGRQLRFFRRKLSPPENPSSEKGAAQAFQLAKELLAKEKMGHKLVIVLSDGGETTCSKNKPRYDDIDTAEQLWNMGIPIFYAPVGDNPNMEQDQADYRSLVHFQTG
ncbi:hypothetical protein OSTOST_03506 [Ostertagia ostertagi]